MVPQALNVKQKEIIAQLIWGGVHRTHYIARVGHFPTFCNLMFAHFADFHSSTKTNQTQFENTVCFRLTYQSDSGQFGRGPLKLRTLYLNLINLTLKRWKGIRGFKSSLSPKRPEPVKSLTPPLHRATQQNSNTVVATSPMLADKKCATVTNSFILELCRHPIV